MINENYVKWGEKKCIKQLYYMFFPSFNPHCIHNNKPQ